MMLKREKIYFLVRFAEKRLCLEAGDGTQGFWQSLFEVPNVGHDVEEGKDIFSCEICGKEFRNEGSLAQHKPIHRINTTCELCGTTLSRVQHYRRHMRTVHNVDPNSILNPDDGDLALSILPISQQDSNVTQNH